MHQLIVLFVAICSLLQVSCANVKKTGEVVNVPIEMAMVLDNRSSRVVEHKAYMVSYNETALLPDWVAYELTEEETDGPLSRRGLRFMPDPDCDCRQADNNDYRHSGYSRGHLAPAGDMKWDSIAMIESFYFTNCIPQDKQLNNGLWNQLEMKTRALARQYGRVYVACGPVFRPTDTLRIGYHGVVVPSACFMALLVPDGDGYQAVAFMMDNGGETRKLKECALSVDELERLVAIDFFFSLPDKVEEQAESSYNLDFWF